MAWNDFLIVGRDLGLFAIGTYAIQRLIKNSADKSVADYKQQLNLILKSHQLNLDVDLERYKAELNLHANRQTSLHEKRSVVILETYTKLIKLVSALQEMTRRGHIVVNDSNAEEQQRVQATHEAYVDYNNYYFYNKLYFSKAINILLESVRAQYNTVSWDYWEPRRVQQTAGGRISREQLDEALNKSVEATRKVLVVMPAILNQLEDEFRTLLGVTEPTPATTIL